MRKRVRPVFYGFRGAGAPPEDALRGVPGVRNAFTSILGSVFRRGKTLPVGCRLRRIRCGMIRAASVQAARRGRPRRFSPGRRKGGNRWARPERCGFSSGVSAETPAWPHSIAEMVLSPRQITSAKNGSLCDSGADIRRMRIHAALTGGFALLACTFFGYREILSPAFRKSWTRLSARFLRAKMKSCSLPGRRASAAMGKEATDLV